MKRTKPKRTKFKKKDEKMRRCLKCDQAFLSEFRGHLICPKCTEANQNVDDPIISGRIRLWYQLRRD